MACTVAQTGVTCRHPEAEVIRVIVDAGPGPTGYERRLEQPQFARPGYGLDARVRAELAVDACACA